ncbi:hypothetical protein FPK48_27260 [Acinetobacter baumannii]|nr:hypothetical protein [Acinetobacter baumannii]MDT1898559.1 hypothetical protein [Acinetobacter baumannii]
MRIKIVVWPPEFLRAVTEKVKKKIIIRSEIRQIWIAVAIEDIVERAALVYYVELILLMRVLEFHHVAFLLRGRH